MGGRGCSFWLYLVVLVVAVTVVMNQLGFRV